MADKSRYFGITLPEGDDSVVASAGLTQLNNFFDLMDTELNAVSDTGVAAYYTALWVASNSPALAASATPANSALTWTNQFTATGSISPTFNTSTGMITFGTAGYYRLTYNFIITGTSVPTEGYFKVGLKESATAAFVQRTAKLVGMEIFLGETIVNASILLKADTTSADVDLTSNYNVTAIQENSSGISATLGGSSTWVALEYVRAL